MREGKSKKRKEKRWKVLRKSEESASSPKGIVYRRKLVILEVGKLFVRRTSSHTVTNSLTPLNVIACYSPSSLSLFYDFFLAHKVSIISRFFIARYIRFNAQRKFWFLSLSWIFFPFTFYLILHSTNYFYILLRSISFTIKDTGISLERVSGRYY